MSNISKISYLNSVAAAAADITVGSPYSYITGLNPIASVIGDGSPDYTLTNSTITKYTYAAGTAKISRFDFSAGSTSGDIFGVTIVYYDSMGSRNQLPDWTYTCSATDDGTLASAALYAYINTALTAAGYTVALAARIINVTSPKNSTFITTKLTTGVYATAAAANLVVTVAQTAGVKRVGYGADIIAEWGLPAASSATANDGISGTGTYTYYTFDVNSPVSVGQNGVELNSYQQIVFVNLIDGDGAALVTAIDEAFIS